jgi:hypothetical protein
VNLKILLDIPELTLKNLIEKLSQKFNDVSLFFTEIRLGSLSSNSLSND